MHSQTQSKEHIWFCFIVYYPKSCQHQLLSQYFLCIQFFTFQLVLLSVLHLLWLLRCIIDMYFHMILSKDLQLILLSSIEYLMNILKILIESFSNLIHSISAKLHIFTFSFQEVLVFWKYYFQKLHSFQDCIV